MFKILTLGILLYLLYRLVFGPPLLGTPQQQNGSNQQLKHDEDDDEYVDYEEVDD